MGNDVPDLRASHEDRNRVVDALRVAAGDGRLSTEELDARLESALSALTPGELAELTADLPTESAAKEMLLVEQEGGKYVREGRWAVPAHMRLRTKLCKVSLDFTDALITSSALHIECEMKHGKLIIVTAPGIAIDADGVTLNYSKLKLQPKDPADHPRLQIEIVGTLQFGKIIEQR